MFDIESVSQLSQLAINELETPVHKSLDKIGIFYRIFSRVKTGDSIRKKIESKKYSIEGKKLQDLIGIRIACYFGDDIPICCTLINEMFEVVDNTTDFLESDTFKPTRLNYVCKIPSNVRELIDNKIFTYYPVDDTFEFQIRTVFSEGWHEIEHDMRYKRKEAWNGHDNLARNLNGLLATLETCDWSILNVFDQLAYKNYKQNDFENMIRDKYRIRLRDDDINSDLLSVFQENATLIKRFFQGDRNELLAFLLTKDAHIPLNINNIIYCINELFIMDEDIKRITPKLIKENVGKFKERLQHQ